MLHMWIFFQLKKCFTTECDFIECPKKGKFFFLILALSVSLSVEQKLKPYKEMLWWLCGNIKIYFDVPYICKAMSRGGKLYPFGTLQDYTQICVDFKLCMYGGCVHRHQF